jgi:hypothetical protein
MNQYALILILTPLLSLANIDHDFFHPAASAFIHGDSTAASNRVERGLQRYPNDPKLMRLKNLLEQQQQEQQEQQNQDDSSEDQNQDSPDSSPDSDPSQNQSDANDQPDTPSDSPSQPEENNSEATPQPMPQAEEMSPEEAQRLLDAMRQDEENKRSQLRPIMGAPFNVERDW